MHSNALGVLQCSSSRSSANGYCASGFDGLRITQPTLIPLQMFSPTCHGNSLLLEALRKFNSVLIHSVLGIAHDICTFPGLMESLCTESDDQGLSAHRKSQIDISTLHVPPQSRSLTLLDSFEALCVFAVSLGTAKSHL